MTSEETREHRRKLLIRYHLTSMEVFGDIKSILTDFIGGPGFSTQQVPALLKRNPIKHTAECRISDVIYGGIYNLLDALTEHHQLRLNGLRQKNPGWELEADHFHYRSEASVTAKTLPAAIVTLRAGLQTLYDDVFYELDKEDTERLSQRSGLSRPIRRLQKQLADVKQNAAVEIFSLVDQIGLDYLYAARNKEDVLARLRDWRETMVRTNVDIPFEAKKFGRRRKTPTAIPS